MTVEQIPSDELVEMTSIWERAFIAAGCRPACHGCNKWIDVGSKFKLATIGKGVARGSASINTIETREVMLCDKCKPDDVEKRDEESVKNNADKRAAGAGCYRINGKIVH